jgi:hypothetical protein
MKNFMSQSSFDCNLKDIVCSYAAFCRVSKTQYRIVYAIERVPYTVSISSSSSSLPLIPLPNGESFFVKRQEDGECKLIVSSSDGGR